CPWGARQAKGKSRGDQRLFGKRARGRPKAPPLERCLVAGTRNDYADTPRNRTPPHQTQPLTDPCSQRGRTGPSREMRSARSVGLPIPGGPWVGFIARAVSNWPQVVL